MRRRFVRAISVTTVGLSVVLGAGCQSPSSGPPKVSGLEKTNLTVGAGTHTAQTYVYTVAPAYLGHYQNDYHGYQ